MEDLPLGRIAALVPEFAMKDVPLGRTDAADRLQMSSAHSPSFPSLRLRLSSFSNPSVVLPTSQLFRQPFHCFTYVTAHSPTLLSLLLRHRLFTQSPFEPTMIIYSNYKNSLNLLRHKLDP